MVLFTLAVPFVNEAKAQVANDNTNDLQVTDETDSNPTGTAHTLTATVSAATGGAVGGVEVDFEVESGPDVRTGCTVGAGEACTGGTANAGSDNTATTPDMTCTTGGDGTCTVRFSADAAGTNVIRGWIDDDKDNATFDADQTEPADACGANEPNATGCSAGSRTEVDDTDVVTKTWFQAVSATASLDCTPETATNPSTGTGSAETYTCTLFNDNGSGTGGVASDGIQNGSEAGISGVKIDAENRNGANDPDDSNTGTGPDYNDGCTTGANGSCDVTISASEAQAGTANICFWGDTDSDAQIVTAPNAAQNDGGGCDEAQDTVDSDLTDVVTKTWRASGVAYNINLSPDSDQNLKGESHTVTATVTDFQGNPVAGTLVDFSVTGRNTASVNGAVTNAQGQATFTYSDVNTGSPNGEQDTITGSVDNDNNGTADNNSAGTAMTDTAQKFWFTTAPTSSSVKVDMVPAGGANTCPDTSAGAVDAADGQLVNQFNPICGAAFDSSGNMIKGEEITFTVDGPGQLARDADNDGLLDEGEGLGSTATVATDADGDADISLFSTESGTTTVTATADGQSATGTKTWRAEAARNITCTPATATNPSGTNHVVTCTATDRWGNPTNDADDDGTAGGAGYGETNGDDDVTFTETGPGRITSDTSPILGSAGPGQVEVVVATVPGEVGDQTITAELTVDVGDTDGPTDQTDDCDALADRTQGGGANSDPGAPAGNCETSAAKTWSDEPQPTETPTEEPTPTITRHDRNVEITGFRHIKLPGKKKPALRVKGFVDAGDFPACHNAVPVKVQLRAGGEWITRKTDVTNENGRWKVLIRDVRGKYRATATKVESTDVDGNIDICTRARDVRRHRHG